jgi:proteasome assembly chaperone (PAC2) family protein
VVFEGEHLQWDKRPALRDPIVIAAFEGWNDAGDAATGAAEFLRDRWSAQPFAEIDPEDFYDFTSTRPRVRLDDDLERVIEWPRNEISAASIPGIDRDIVLIIGTEPQLRWRTFCEQVLAVVDATGSRLVLTLGALLAEVAHSRPVSVIGTSTDPEVMGEMDLQRSTYQGPTGIVGVLQDLCRRNDVPSASLWAAVPTYVPNAPSPKAALALVERASELLEVGVTTTDLEIAAASYERQVTEVVESDEETADYVRSLEERYDDGDEPEDPASLVEEIERFLREEN